MIKMSKRTTYFVSLFFWIENISEFDSFVHQKKTNFCGLRNFKLLSINCLIEQFAKLEGLILSQFLHFFLELTKNGFNEKTNWPIKKRSIKDFSKFKNCSKDRCLTLSKHSCKMENAMWKFLMCKNEMFQLDAFQQTGIQGQVMNVNTVFDETQALFILMINFSYNLP